MCKSRKMCWFLPYSRLFKPFSILMNCTHIISTVWSQCSRRDTKATEKATDRMSCHCLSEQRQLSAICSGDESSQHQNQLDSIKRLNPTAARSCPQTDLSSRVTSDMTCEGWITWLAGMFAQDSINTEPLQRKWLLTVKTHEIKMSVSLFLNTHNEAHSGANWLLLMRLNDNGLVILSHFILHCSYVDFSFFFVAFLLFTCIF